MITPRHTRLVRVADLHVFRDVVAALSLDGALADTRARLVLVPTRGAGRQLQRTLEDRAIAAPCRRRAIVLPDFVTRDQLYDRLHVRLATPPRRLSPYEREVLLAASARGAVHCGAAPPFQLRPGLIAEILRFYDQLRRNRQSVTRFEELLEQPLARDAEFDAGAERMVRQTRFLAETFRAYQVRLDATGACDEHALRDRLVAEPSADPIRDLVVTVGDWIADPNGLFSADFDLLARVPGVERVTLVATEALLGSGFHQRLHEWLPDIEETGAAALGLAAPRVRPVLETPRDAGGRPWFVSRDREEELVAIARRLKRDARNRAVAPDTTPALDRSAVVFKRPLPYLYLARSVFGDAAIAYATSDALPLAAEPFPAAVDLVLEFAASRFSRDAMIALLRSPHFTFEHDGRRVSRLAVAALDRALAEARYLGELDRLESLAASWSAGVTSRHARADRDLARPALDAGLAAARHLAPLLSEAPTSQQLGRLLAFLAAHPSAFTAEDDPLAARERRARSTVASALDSLAAAHAAFADVPCTIEELAAAVRRWIEEETFVPDSEGAGLQLVDLQAARYADFDAVHIVGVIEGEWPERARRNIFYGTALLSTLGWPSEKDRRGAGEAAFLDLIASARLRVTVSVFTLDDEALVEPSGLVDEIPRARLTTVETPTEQLERVFAEEALSLDPVRADVLGDRARTAARVRLGRSAPELPMFHGFTAERPAQTWAVSALEIYLACPFKFFAQHVLKLEEEPEDEEVMDPSSRGEFMHGVFEAFFRAWHDSGRRAITAANLDEARAVFAAVVEQHVAALPDAEAALERTRLLGSPAAGGLGEVVLRMEAERRVGVVDRLLEQRLEGTFVFIVDGRERRVALNGKADRIDLLEDGTFRLIDYKSGYPPQKARSLQLPIYALCAEQHLQRETGRSWSVGEAAYIAFRGPKRISPLFSTADERTRALGEAQVRLVTAIEAIERGEFPPTPVEPHRCSTCSFAAVCRKDYVGDV